MFCLAAVNTSNTIRTKIQKREIEKNKIARVKNGGESRGIGDRKCAAENYTKRHGAFLFSNCNQTITVSEC